MITLRDLQVQFRTPRALIRAVNGVNLTVQRGEVVATYNPLRMVKGRPQG